MSAIGKSSVAKDDLTKRILAVRRGVPHDLPVVRIYEQADLAPLAAHPHVRQIRADVGVGPVTGEHLRDDVRRIRLARLRLRPRCLLVLADAAEVVRLEGIADAPPGRRPVPSLEHGLYPSRASMPASSSISAAERSLSLKFAPSMS